MSNNLKGLEICVMSKEPQIAQIKEETETYSDDALFNITSFGTDLSFRELITMYNEGDLEKPELQRKYVWNRNEASRFIDSILLGLPVPSIFLAKTQDEKRLIVDGYQRIMTVYDYVERGIFGGDNKSFNLSRSEIINAKWRGKTFKELSPEEQRKIKSSPIHAIVFEQKHPQDDSGMFQIFERINTSGRPLKPQEIRNCVYHGFFNQLLIDLNKHDKWRLALGAEQEDSRMADMELILRIFAFSDLQSQPEYENTRINLVKYLNSYMARYSNLNAEISREFTQKFNSVIDFLFDKIGVYLFRNGKRNGEGVIESFTPKVNPAIMDSLCAAGIKYYSTHDNTFASFDGTIDVFGRYKMLLENNDYQEAISKRTTNIETIKSRINLASTVLFGVDYGW